MQITDIIPDFSTLSDAEVEEVIRRARRSRTTVKAVTVTKRPTKTVDKTKGDVKAVLDSMNPEQLALLKKLFS